MAWPPEAGQPLQRAAEAVGVRERLADCSLNPESEFGAPKAHGFALILGIRLEHLDHLEAEIRSGILTTLVASVRENAIHRVNCVVDLPVRGLRDKQDRAVNTRTVWELADKDAAPRLVSAFVKPGRQGGARGPMAGRHSRYVVSERDDLKLVEISDPDAFGAALDFISAESRLKLINKHGD